MNNAQILFSMPGVGFIGMLIIGILAGYIAEKVTSSDHGLLTISSSASPGLSSAARSPMC
jgi:fructose-specific phosphotransferase system IIC component